MRSAAALELDALRFEEKRRKLVFLTLVLIAPTLVFAAIDLTVLGRQDARFLALVALRVVAIGIAAFILLVVARLRDEARFNRAVGIISWVIVVLVLAVHLLRPAAMSTPYFFEVVVIVALYAILPSRWRHQVVPAVVLTGAGLLFLLVRHVDLALVDRVAIATALLVANGIGAAIARNWHWYDLRERALLRREEESSRALASTTAELQVLQKILPICSHCRNVRDGAGAWAQLEAYVRAHSETRFSHGICPDCLERHYPDHASELR